MDLPEAWNRETILKKLMGRFCVHQGGKLRDTTLQAFDWFGSAKSIDHHPRYREIARGRIALDIPWRCCLRARCLLGLCRRRMHFVLLGNVGAMLTYMKHLDCGALRGVLRLAR